MKKALWDGPYDDELYCVSGMTTNHPAGAALPCYRRAYGKLKQEVAAAEERGRRAGIEERDKLVLAVQELLHAMEYREKTDAGEYRVAENVIKSAWERAKAEGLAALRALAPRDSGKEDRK